MKWLKKGIFIICTLLLTIILVINLYSFVSIKVFKQDVATIAGYSMLEVVSGSMEPTIHVGDMIIINTKDTNYEVDDIVTFYDVNGAFVTHRIKSIENDMMVTKGDYNDSYDEPLPLESIVGKYVFKINNGGKIIASFKSPFTMVMILIIGVGVCVFISTDKDGNPILEADELEFQEYLKNKEKKTLEKPVQKKVKREEKGVNKKSDTSKIKEEKSVKKSSAVKKATTKKETAKKATTKKTVIKKAGTKNTKKNK